MKATWLKKNGEWVVFSTTELFLWATVTRKDGTMNEVVLDPDRLPVPYLDGFIHYLYPYKEDGFGDQCDDDWENPLLGYGDF